MAWSGNPAIDGTAAAYIQEFAARTELAKLGYRFDPRDLSPEKADVFLIISSEISKIQKEEVEQKTRKGARR